MAKHKNQLVLTFNIQKIGSLESIRFLNEIGAIDIEKLLEDNVCHLCGRGFSH